MIGFNVLAQNRDKIDWVSGKIVTKDSVIYGEMCMNTGVRGGLVLMKRDQKISAYSPNQIISFSFTYKNGDTTDSVFFESVPTNFFDPSKNGVQFLRSLEKGDRYELYSSYFPEEVLHVNAIPLGGVILIGFVKYIENLDVLYLKVNGYATQISRPNKFNVGYESKKVILDKRVFYSLLKEKKQFVKLYKESNRLKYKSIEDITQLVAYLNTLE